MFVGLVGIGDKLRLRKGEPSMVWDMKIATYMSPEYKELLAADWEPFAVAIMPRTSPGAMLTVLDASNGDSVDQTFGAMVSMRKQILVRRGEHGERAFDGAQSRSSKEKDTG